MIGLEFGENLNPASAVHDGEGNRSVGLVGDVGDADNHVGRLAATALLPSPLEEV